MARISRGNEKLGGIPNISLTSCVSCAKDAPCKKSCYANKLQFRPNVRKAWAANLKQARANPAEFFLDVQAYLYKKQPKFFRWHVAGDILNAEYFKNIRYIAALFPKTKFLCFTKRHDLLKDIMSVCLPDNLAIIASMWPGWGDPEKVKGYSKAWMQDGTETRIPADAIECPGSCETCGACWGLSKIGKDVVFNKH